MKIGNKIKKYRENINLSQEELADKVYVSRQTVSNWENNRSYPDINSLTLLSNIFDISLDKFIEEDIEEMKKETSEYDLKEYNTLSVTFSIGLIIILLSAYPLLKFVGITGIIIWSLIYIITMYIGIKIEKIYRKNDIRTYKEILAFTENKTLSTKEKIEERAKRPYQKFLLGLFSGIMAIIIFILLDLIFK